jgi:hypothetical protein
MDSPQMDLVATFLRYVELGNGGRVQWVSVHWAADSFHRLVHFMNNTFKAKIYTRWRCIDRFSRHDFTGLGIFGWVTAFSKSATGKTAVSFST